MDLNELDNMVDVMIKASNEANITKEQLVDTFNYGGLMGVYNLGLRHMYEYLKAYENKKVEITESNEMSIKPEELPKFIAKFR